MGIDVFLEDERGEPLRNSLDSQGFLARLFEECAELGPACLRFIDPYGDTTFNRLQMPALIEELEAAIRRTDDERVAEHCRSVLGLARECRDGIHLYLKFYGD